MPIELENYGTVLTSKETIELTGFTANQLRNWRMPQRRHLAPFGFLQLGNMPYYLEEEVIAYIAEHGKQEIIYHPNK
jgi:hypothetical protein